MKVKEFRINPQAKINTEICDTIRDIANKNGGLPSLTEKAGINYWTLWNQLNNRTTGGISVSAVVQLVNATGNILPLQIQADACGCLVIRKTKPARNIRSVRKQELDLYSQLTSAVKEIEGAYLDGIVDRYEYKQINFHLNELRRLTAELAERIRQGVRL